MAIDWGSLRAKDALGKRLAVLRPDESLRDAAELFLAERVSGAPVVDEEGRAVGVLSQTDLMRRTCESAYGQLPPFYMEGEHIAVAAPAPVHDLSPVREAMSRDVVSVDEDVPLLDVARLMSDRRVHRILVSREGKLAGVVSTMDFVRLIAQGEVGEAGAGRRRTARRPGSRAARRAPARAGSRKG